MYRVTEVPSGDSATLGKITTDKVRAVELVRNAEPRKVEKPQGLTGRGPLGRGREAASSGRDLRYTEELNSIIRT